MKIVTTPPKSLTDWTICTTLQNTDDFLVNSQYLVQQKRINSNKNKIYSDLNIDTHSHVNFNFLRLASALVFVSHWI